MEVKDIVKEAVIIGENASFKDALSMMIHKQTNSILVTNSDGILVGEVSVSDLMDAIMPDYLNGDSIAANFATEEMFEEAVRDAADQKVHDFMSSDVQSVHMDDGLMAVAAVAIAQQKARIPVVDVDNRPVGIISRRGLKHLIAQFLNITDSA